MNYMYISQFMRMTTNSSFVCFPDGIDVFYSFLPQNKNDIFQFKSKRKRKRILESIKRSLYIQIEY